MKNRSSVFPSGNCFLSHIRLERAFLLFSVQPVSCCSEPVQNCPRISPAWKRRRITAIFRLKPTGFITNPLANVFVYFQSAVLWEAQRSSYRSSPKLGRNLCTIPFLSCFFGGLWQFFICHWSPSNPYFYPPCSARSNSAVFSLFVAA